jgi:LytS/YehU family sensor histidine kinase
MDVYLSNVSDFIQDTCVVVVFAYLLTRGKIVRLLLRERMSTREAVLFGISLGLVGLTERFIPQIGFKYASASLCIAFAASIGGLPVVLITASILALGSTIGMPRNPISLVPTAVISVLLAPIIRDADSLPRRLLGGFVTGVLVQSSRLLTAAALRHLWGLPPLPEAALFSIPTNGFGLALLLLVISDAQVRADSEQRRIEIEQERADAEHAHALAVEAQLSALRARVHPHFLFNALNSIAELCCIAPARAEAASLHLSHLMRRALETGDAATIPLRQELTLTHAYLKIEQERFGERLCIDWQIEPSCEDIPVIPFSMQVLVENAINHGLAPKPGRGTVTIVVRRSASRTLVAVHDDGVGMTPEARRERYQAERRATHGLQILNQQLALYYGDRARLRFFSQATKGTFAVFALPGGQAHGGKAESSP